MAHKYQTFADLLYARVKRPDLSLEDVCLLDRIQKHLGVTAAAVAHLRREGLIEGRMPHPHISAVVAEATGRQAEYMRKKELPGSRYKAMLIDYIGKFNGLTRGTNLFTNEVTNE